MNNNSTGHILAFITTIIWGTTFISTKILLLSFNPIEILFVRFILGLLALFLVCPRHLQLNDRRQELTFALAGLTGVCLYYLMENIALTYTSASNVGVIIASAPFFTALLNRKEEKPSINFYIGFLLSIIGIAFISFSSSKLKLNPLGDLLTLLAAFTWACYSMLTKKISTYGYNVIQTTRRIFIYGIAFMLPTLAFWGVSFESANFSWINILNLIYLGFGASALCFVTWNSALKILGATRTTVYIYLTPVVTVAASVIVLHERLTLSSVLGTLLTLLGLVLSQSRQRYKG